jgi:hypothetical protein
VRVYMYNVYIGGGVQDSSSGGSGTHRGEKGEALSYHCTRPYATTV